MEACFRVLKEPYFIDELFVKIPQRLEALAYVMIISLMVLNLLERNIRTSFKEDGGYIRIVGKIKTDISLILNYSKKCLDVSCNNPFRGL